MPTFTGQVLQEPVGGVSKSARRAVVLRAGKETWILRLPGGNAMHDPALDAWVGKTVHIEGRPHRNILLIDTISEQPASPKKK